MPEAERGMNIFKQGDNRGRAVNLFCVHRFWYLAVAVHQLTRRTPSDFELLPTLVEYAHTVGITSKCLSTRINRMKHTCCVRRTTSSKDGSAPA